MNRGRVSFYVGPDPRADRLGNGPYNNLPDSCFVFSKSPMGYSNDTHRGFRNDYREREYLAIGGAHKLKLKKMSGYNTEIEHNDLMFHVQTQDQGANAHYVESVVYRSGKVLASRRTYYTNFLNRPSLMDKINKIIEEQHEGVLKDINEGKFDHL